MDTPWPGAQLAVDVFCAGLGTMFAMWLLGRGIRRWDYSRDRRRGRPR